MAEAPKQKADAKNGHVDRQEPDGKSEQAVAGKGADGPRQSNQVRRRAVRLGVEPGNIAPGVAHEAQDGEQNEQNQHESH